MNEKGFAVTGLLYIILILFLSLYASMLAMYTTRKNMLEQIKQEVIGDAVSSSNVGRQASTQDIGKYVDYIPDNANWILTVDEVSAATGTTQGTFDIYDLVNQKAATGSSKGESITCNDISYQNQNNGWRIMNVDVNGNMTLIHAGTPECYYHAMGQATNSVSILSTASTSTNDGNSKAWTKYGNSVYAASVHYMTGNDFDTIQGTRNAYSNLCYLKTCSMNDLLNIGSFYYLAVQSTSDYMYNIDAANIYAAANKIGSVGVRPVIVLNTNVKIGTGYGTKADPYQLII